MIEDEELERAWRKSRRQRQKVQEEKIWQEFCGEQDIVSHMSNGRVPRFICLLIKLL